MSETKHLLAITACPSGVAHTYMAAEHLEQAARERGYTMSVETHGQIGVENPFTDEQLEQADAIIVAADKKVPLDRFGGKPVVVTSVHDGIHKPGELIDRALAAPRHAGGGTGTTSTKERSGVYGMLMNGVSHMIPFVVVGGLLLALAFGIGGEPTPQGLVIPEDSLWNTVMQVGSLAFGLMVPILSGYIAYAIADRPGLAPGMITGLIAITPALYNAEAGAGFLGGIVTGFLSGFVALAIKKIKVHKYIQSIWPIIVIPVATTVLVGGVFIFLIGAPIAALFAGLTNFLASMQGASAILLGILLGAMIAFDMGGPVNKVAFLFAGGLLETGNYVPMGIVAVAIAVPPIGMALATLIARRLFTPVEREAGIAALFMGFFGITEGAIPFAAARPLQVIPANMIGGAVGGAVAGILTVQAQVMWGGVIDVVVGAVPEPVKFLIALAIGSATTAAVALLLMGISTRRHRNDAPTEESTTTPADPAPTPEGSASVLDYISDDLIVLDSSATTRDEIITELVERGATAGHIRDVAVVRASALAREELTSTAVGNNIAIPHAKSSGVASPMVAFARPTRGIDWDSPSDDLAELVFLIAVPKESAGDEHLRILARLSRALVHEATREALRSARTPVDVRRVLAEAID